MAARAPSTPPRLEGFEVVRHLGSGGFSDVFLYLQELPRRTVAVKVLRSPAHTEAARAAFTSEADLMARLSTHPYIVTIHGAGVAGDGRPYFVMEYCSRPSLAERYKRRPLPVADALRTGIRLASAVETAHRAGILHRDVKPGNVLTNDYGWPALTDFGIAAAADASPTAEGATEPDPDSSGGALGLSVPWSPPEMFLDDPRADARSDVFSLAATVHTVLAGRTPFEVPGGPNGAVDLIGRIERGELRPLGRDDAPRELAAVLSRGMAPRREDRFPSAAEFGRALQRIELTLGYAPTALEIPEPVVDHTPEPSPLDEEETRVRGVVTVHPDAAEPPRRRARPDPESPAGGARPGPEAPAGGARPRPEAPAGRSRPGPEAPAGRSRSGPAAPAGRARTRLIAVFATVLAVLTVAAVVLAVALGGIGPPFAPEPAHTVDTAHTARPTGDPALIGGPVPSPVDGLALVVGERVEFRWTNPDPSEGDLYYWARSERPNDREVVREPTVTVDGVVPGVRVCIDVAIGRAGRTSPPLQICTAP